jgi:DNA-binding transcriptional LysR family regulator
VLVSQLGSLSAAARQTHLAVAAASRRLRELETSVGQALFTRQRYGMVMTEAGQIASRHALSVLQAMDSLGQDLQDLSIGTNKRIRLCASTAAIVQYLPPMMARFMQLNPQLLIELEEQMSDGVAHAVREARADLGVMAHTTELAGLRSLPFCEDELVVVFAANHKLAKGKQPLSFEALVDQDWIMLAQGAALVHLLQGAAQRMNVPLNMRMQVRSFEAMAQLIASGLGIGLMPRLAAEQSSLGRALKLRALKDPWARRRLHIVMRQDTEDSAVHGFAHYLSGQVSQNVKP